MIIKIFGLLDIASAIIFWLSSITNFVSNDVLLVIGFYLLIKGGIFLLSKDIASIFDVVSSVVIFFSIGVSMPFWVVMIVALFLLQKGIFSLIS